MLFVSAVTQFHKKNQAEKIPDFRPGKEGQLRRMSPARVDGIVTHVRNALRRASARQDVDHIDIQPYILILPEMAHRDAAESGRANPANEASAVRTFLRVVANLRYDAAYKPRVKAADFLATWHDLAEASMGDKTKGRASRNPGWLQELQNTLLRNGVHSPIDMPDYATVQSWSIAGGHTIKDFGNHIGAYRAAREALGANGAKYPALSPPARAHVRGLTSLPNLKALVRAGVESLRSAGHQVQEPLVIDALPTLDLLDYIAPHLAQHTRMYLDAMKETQGVGPDWLGQVVTSTGCLVAELIRLGENVAELDHMDLYLQRRQVPRTTIVAARLVQSRRALSASMDEEVSLLRKVIDASACRSAQASSLSLESGPKASGVPFYTPAVFNQASAIWSVTERVYGEALGHASHPDAAQEWREVEAERIRLSKHMKSFNSTLPIVGHATRGMLMLNWGAAICVGLRELWMSARRRRTIWHQAFEKHRDEDARPVRIARRRYLCALEKWVLGVVFLDDGLRVKQYARGRLGVNFLLDGPKDAATGKLIGVTGVHTHFRGYDAHAGLKMRTSSGQERMRHRQLTPGLVDAELMTDYIFELRFERLMNLGLVASRAAYNPASDGYTFFVSSNSTKADGRFLRARLSKKVGRLLHHIARDLVGVRDENGQELPSWSAIQERSPAGKALRRRWRAVWNSHPTRRIIATYLGGILGDWHEAEDRTNDSDQTLRTYYLSREQLVKRMRQDPGLNNPDRYKDVMKRLMMGELIDWTTFDPWHPELARWISPLGPDLGPKGVKSAA